MYVRNRGGLAKDLNGSCEVLNFAIVCESVLYILESILMVYAISWSRLHMYIHVHIHS